MDGDWYCVVNISDLAIVYQGQSLQEAAERYLPGTAHGRSTSKGGAVTKARSKADKIRKAMRRAVA